MSNDFDYVIVLGYGWSGSSAIVDLLREFDSCYESNIEFRAIKDPYGVHDLHHAIVECWELLNVDAAIKDFWWQMWHLNNHSKRFSLQAGLDYEKYFHNQFLPATQNFLKKLIPYYYRGFWWFFDFKRDGIRFFFKKVFRKLKLYEKIYEDKIYFSAVNDQDFCQYAQEYMDELFAPLINPESIKHVVLDQAVHLSSYKEETRYFRSSKLIVVDRDPRDIYADLVQGENVIGKDLAESHDVMKYIQMHRQYRKNITDLKSDPNVLFIQFEELIQSYDAVVERIVNFLGLNMKDHTRKKQYFNPEISKKNMGIWKNVLMDKEKQVIEAELGDYIPDEIYKEID